jgi:hypothetical protein
VVCGFACLRFLKGKLVQFHATSCAIRRGRPMCLPSMKGEHPGSPLHAPLHKNSSEEALSRQRERVDIAGHRRRNLAAATQLQVSAVPPDRRGNSSPRLYPWRSAPGIQAQSSALLRESILIENKG